MVTQQDVALRAGVSFITVSRVVNNMGNVKPETRERVLKAIEELRYYPNSIGRSLNSNRLNTLGIVVPTLPGVSIYGTAYYSGLMVGVERACSEMGFDMLISTLKYEGNDYDYLKTYYQRKNDGLILIAPDMANPQLAIIAKEKIPCVVVGERPKEISFIDVDNYHGAMDLTRQVIRMKHRRIAFVKGVGTNGNANERYQGYLDAMAEADLQIQEEWIIDGDMTPESGRQAFAKLMSVFPRPTAMICANDSMAYGVLNEARARGLVIPNALSVAGFDGLDPMGGNEPFLSTVRQPVEAMGYKAASILIRQVQEGNFDIETLIFPVEVVVGSSLGRPMK